MSKLSLSSDAAVVHPGSAESLVVADLRELTFVDSCGEGPRVLGAASIAGVSLAAGRMPWGRPTVAEYD
jgi:hypothetical protein